MVELGLFEGERVELIYGVVVEMSPKGDRHDGVIEWLNERLVLGLAQRASVRVQSAFAASDGSRPEPDLAIVDRSDHRLGHPTEAHLIIEVAESSLKYDRDVKSKLYAECGVPEYWIVNLVDDIVEVHTDVVRGVYTSVMPERRGGTVAPQAFGDVVLDVSELLG